MLDLDSEAGPDAVRREATRAELHAFLDALGLDRTALHAGHAVAVASPGRERLLLPVTDAGLLARAHPDMPTLAAVSRHFRQLGCLVYVPPSRSGRFTELTATGVDLRTVAGHLGHGSGGARAVADLPGR